MLWASLVMQKMNNSYVDKAKSWLLDEKYGGQESDEYRADLLRLEQGEPVDYVIGFIDFLGVRVDLSCRPLIPRAETEHWVGKAIAEIKEKHSTDEPLQFLDIFSGSGCIGLALLANFPQSVVTFVDVDPNAIAQIKKNLELQGHSDTRYNIYQSDMFDNLPDVKFDAIFANPPYIASRDTVADAVLKYEPYNALFAIDEGMELIKRTLDGAREYLRDSGVLYMEYDDGQEGKIGEYLENIGWAGARFDRDQYGMYRSMRAEYCL